MQYVAKNVV